RLRLCDVADDCGELLRARPHGPVARGQVDPGHVAELGKAGEPGVVLFDGVLVLLGGVPRGDDRGRHIEARIVRQLDGLAQDATRLWNRSAPEGFELLATESVEVLVLREL